MNFRCIKGEIILEIVNKVTLTESEGELIVVEELLAPTSTPVDEMIPSLEFQEIIKLQGQITKAALYMEGNNQELRYQIEREVNQVKKETCIMIDNMKKQVDVANNKTQEVEKELASYEDNNSRLQKSLEKQDNKVKELSKQLTESQKYLSEAEDANIELEEQKEQLEEKLTTTDKKLEEQTQNLSKALEDNKLQYVDLEKAQTEITDITSLLDTLQQELDELKNNKVEFTESDMQTITIEVVEQKSSETQTEKVEEQKSVSKSTKKVKICKIKTCSTEISKGSLCEECKKTHKLVKGKDGKTRIKKR